MPESNLLFASHGVNAATQNLSFAEETGSGLAAATVGLRPEASAAVAALKPINVLRVVSISRAPNEGPCKVYALLGSQSVTRRLSTNVSSLPHPVNLKNMVLN